MQELTARVGAAEIDFQSAEVVSSRVQGWINSKRQGEELELKKLNAGQETGEHFIKIQGGMPIMPGCEQLIMPHQVVSNGRVLEGNTAQGLLNPQPGPKTIEHVEASSPQIESTPENPAHDTET